MPMAGLGTGKRKAQIDLVQDQNRKAKHLWWTGTLWIGRVQLHDGQEQLPYQLGKQG